MGRIAGAIVTGALMVFLAGCAGQEPTRLDENWGRSFESAKYNQILNPEAGKTADPVSGMDGAAADRSLEKYRNTFKNDKKEENVTILKLQ